MKFNLVKFFFSVLFFSCVSFSEAQYINVNTTYTSEDLVRNIFFGGQNSSCILVENIQISGWDFGNGHKSFGYFNKNASSFSMDEGILLSTGSVLDGIGPNSYIQSQNAAAPHYTSSWQGDPDLENALHLNGTINATVLEFDFTTSLSTQISFEYLFASEQYLTNPNPNQCGYTDGFAFLIKKADGSTAYENLALVPNTNIPVSVNTIRGSGTVCPAANEEYFGSFNPVNSPTNFNGETKILQAKGTIETGVKYHLKIVIADQGNGFYDSAVFLKAGSFSGYKNLGPDRLVSLGTALCEGSSLVLDAANPGSTYQWFKDGVAISGATSAQYTVDEPGFYEVKITAGSCYITGSIKIEYTEKPLVSEKTFSFCDDDLDGTTTVNLQNLNTQLVNNYSQNFVFKYYHSQADANAGNTNTLPNSFSYSGNVSVFVRVENGTCIGDIKPLHLNTGSKILLNSPSAQEICDNDLDGNVSVNLSDYIPLFTTQPGVNVSYFENLQNAQTNSNPISNPALSFNTDKEYYYRFSSSTSCPNIGSVFFKIKSPKKSDLLHDSVTCPNSAVLLDAGPGFDFYLWDTGETTPTILAQIGEHYVDLGFNGCVYRQVVNVTAAQSPTITQVDVSGSTVTVYGSGGTLPYSYSLDGVNFQESNIFYNVPRGTHAVYLKSGDGCYIVETEFAIINILNVITPNGDGYNDVLNYADLKIKNSALIQIFDRYGSLIYHSESSNFSWDGKINGRPLPTGSYWYVISWEEPGNQQKKEYQGWILLKNRN